MECCSGGGGGYGDLLADEVSAAAWDKELGLTTNLSVLLHSLSYLYYIARVSLSDNYYFIEQ